VLSHCWLGDRKGIRSVKSTCTATAVPESLLLSTGHPEKWPFKQKLSDNYNELVVSETNVMHDAII